VPTKEEKQSKDSEKIPPKEEKGYSWVVIGLAVVIIILIIIVIYYVLKYNEVSHAGDLIPNNVVKPTQAGMLGGMFGTVPVVPATHAEPTKKDLDSVLTRLSTIKEEDESKISEVVSESDSDSDSELDISVVQTTKPVVQTTKPVVQTTKPVLKSILKPILQMPKTVKKIVEIVETSEDEKNDTTNNAFLLSENFEEEDALDPELLEEIIDNANL